MSLLQLIWGSYLRSALVPVFFIELALIGVYLGTNGLIRDQNISTVQRLATEQLQATARRQADGIGLQLAAVAQNTEMLRRQSAHAFSTPFVPDAEERSRYALDARGVFHTVRDLPGRAAFICFRKSCAEAAEQRMALQLSQIDPLLEGVVRTQPLVVQAYVNDRKSSSRIYPPVDLLGLFEPDFNVLDFNFFYEADAAHNPERKVVWTDVYIDPAGQGWIASAIAPVYPGNGSRLEAVVGLDITVDTFIQQVLKLRLPWNGYGMLVGKDGTILALPSSGERDWKLKELTQHAYSGSIQQDTFKPASFNLLKRDDSRALGEKLMAGQDGLTTVALEGRDKQVAWSTVAGTGWKLLVIVDEADIFAEAQAHSARINRVGLGMLAGLGLFYALFSVWLYNRVRRVSSLLAAPLVSLEGMMRRIAQGSYEQPEPAYPVLELQRTGEGLVHMGRVLGQSNAALQETRKSLEQLNQELELRIHERTRELEDANATLQKENLARQALIQELRRAQSQLIESEKLASMGQLTAGIAHEIKNPLNLINNLSEVNVELSTELEGTLRARPQALLREVEDVLQDLKQNSHVVQQQGERADRIIRSMMDHARGRSGEFRPVDVNPLVEEYVRLTYHGERARGPELRVTFVQELEPGVGHVPAAPEELGRVLQNLLQNALYAVATKQRQSTDAAYVPTITVRTWRDGDSVWLQVRDNGPGIPGELRGRIFEPFFTTKPPGAGNTGLGLSLSYDIVVTMHGGSLTVESEPGQYACFTVRLPAHRQPPVRAATG